MIITRNSILAVKSIFVNILNSYYNRYTIIYGIFTNMFNKKLNLFKNDKVTRYYKNVKTKSLKKRIVITFFIISILLIFFKDNLFMPIKINDNAMYPTIKKGQYYIVNKIKLGLKKPFVYFKNNKYLIKYHSLKRGDIVCLLHPSIKINNSFINFIIYPIEIMTLGIFNLRNEKFQFKRILATSRDKISIKDKKIYINDKLFIPDWKIYYKDKRILPSSLSPRDNMQEIIIPYNKVFVISDNWDYASDSRFYDLVDVGRIVGIKSIKYLKK